MYEELLFVVGIEILSVYMKTITCGALAKRQRVTAIVYKCQRGAYLAPWRRNEIRGIIALYQRQNEYGGRFEYLKRIHQFRMYLQ